MKTTKPLLALLIMLAWAKPSLSEGNAETNVAKTNSITPYELRTNEGYRTNYIALNGEITTYEEALPKLKQRLNNSEKTNVIAAVKTLQWYGDSIAGSDVMDRLIALYYQTTSPAEQDVMKLSKQAAADLELKGQLLIAIVMSGDHRRDKVLSDARNDSHYVTRALADALTKEVNKTDHFRRGHVPVPSTN